MCEIKQTGEQCWSRLASLLQAFMEKMRNIWNRSKHKGGENGGMENYARHAEHREKDERSGPQRKRAEVRCQSVTCGGLPTSMAE